MKINDTVIIRGTTPASEDYDVGVVETVRDGAASVHWHVGRVRETISTERLEVLVPESAVEAARLAVVARYGDTATASETAPVAPLVVYTIVARERDGKRFWIRVGSATRDRDGQINVVLDAVPTNGTLAIRAQRPASEP